MRDEVKKYGAIMAVIYSVLMLGPMSAFAKSSILNSPHNLSASGPGGKHGIVFSEEQQVCIFCHVPHNAEPAGQLWSRVLTPVTSYIPYDSSTIKANPKPDKPTGSSRLCLSCHDGTIALGSYIGNKVVGGNSGQYMPSDINPTRNANLTTDLSNDHPISFNYTETLAAQQGELVYPTALTPLIKLQGGQVLQCTSCHDPHNNEFGNFLVINNSQPGSPLCIACHNNRGWQLAAHNPANTPALAPACMNCHYVHNAPGPERLLVNRKTSDNCTLACHNGTDIVSPNIKLLFDSGLHRHPIDLSATVHDENEPLPAADYHVECVDCHNPHQANASGTKPLSTPPYINGTLGGVAKDNQRNSATKEYEICFKCHSGVNASKFSGVTELKPIRMIQEADQNKRFDSQNTASFHPVMGLRRGDGASLNITYQTNMQMIYCSDCHNSEQSSKAGGSGPSGPHGSRYEHILLARYDMPEAGTTRQSYSSSQYDLCFRCHAEPYVMGSGTGFTNGVTNEHVAHVTDPDRLIPCFACHDPHGISLQSLGNPLPSLTGNAHLVNFNRAYAASAAVPAPAYLSRGPGSGGCTVSCHTSADHTHSYTR